jgi:uncharacterized OB-fold protein
MTVGAHAPAKAEPASETADPASEIAEAARALIAQGEGTPLAARDPVNLPEIRSWTEALGDSNPVYTDVAAARVSVHGAPVAPPAMLQVWTMAGLARPRTLEGSHPFADMLKVLDQHGYTSVLATNCEQSYDRYLHLGELPVATGSLESVVGPKRTAMGEGYFVTSRVTWRVGDETVGQMLFRVLKYRPPAPKPTEKAAEAAEVAPARGSAPVGATEAYPLAPVISQDTAFFWSGLRIGELRIQRCVTCGSLRHPPGPLCPLCHSTDRDHLVASGTGEIYSYVVHHHPPVPGKKAPFVVAVVALPEGVRMVGNVMGEVADVRDRLRIGAPVTVFFEPVGGDLVLPSWRLTEGGV